MANITLRSLLLLLPISLCSCLGMYYAPVQQGHVFEEENLSALKEGMSYQEVIALLGQPLPPQQEGAQSLHYYNSLVDAHKKVHIKHLTIHFQDGRVQSWDLRQAEAFEKP